MSSGPAVSVRVLLRSAATVTASIAATAIVASARIRTPDKELPLRWMQVQGWIDTCSHAGQQVSACLNDFAVASIEAWRERCGQPLAVCRSSKSYATQQGTLASWLCRAETQAASIACRPYAAKAFRTALQEIRALSCEADPSMFVPQLQALAGATGVAVVFVPAPPGCRVSGATQWLNLDRG